MLIKFCIWDTSDKDYINICTSKKVERGIHKFLKLNRAIYHWEKEWINNLRQENKIEVNYESLYSIKEKPKN